MEDKTRLVTMKMMNSDVRGRLIHKKLHGDMNQCINQSQPHLRLNTTGESAFSCAGPAASNRLPHELTAVLLLFINRIRSTEKT